MWQPWAYCLESIIARTGQSVRRIALAVLSVSLLAGCSITPPPNVQAVKPFDLNRYLGQWYEIARLDHRFERGLTHVKATYTLKSDGTIEVLNEGFNVQTQKTKQAIGQAQFTGASNEGALKVTFFWPFYGGYFIADLDPDYQWSMVIGPNLNYFWILARTPTLDERLRKRLIQRAQSLGIQTDAIIWVDQSAHLNLPGQSVQTPPQTAGSRP
jgi:apolipoprotein D and lipocalin family protein